MRGTYHGLAPGKPRLIATKGGQEFECARYRNVNSRNAHTYWRCGVCKRGKILLWTKECKVCGASILRADSHLTKQEEQ